VCTSIHGVLFYLRRYYLSDGPLSVEKLAIKDVQAGIALTELIKEDVRTLFLCLVKIIV
jgi:hypothetical protein